MGQYDVIVVGAGNGGLIAAQTLLKKGYKVLILEEHNDVGGMCKNITKGRFEFMPSFHSLFVNNDEQFNVPGLLKYLGVDEEVSFEHVKTDFKIICNDNSDGVKEYCLPFGINKFIEKIEKYCKGSKQSVTDFFSLGEECRNALNYIDSNKNNIDYDYLKDNYENFTHIGNKSLSKVLDSIKMPLEVQEIINSFWIYFGSSETEISFVHYAAFVYDLINNGIKIPKNGSYDIALTVLNAYLENGGEIRYNSKVNNIIVEKGICKGVKLLDGTVFKSNIVIANSNEKNVYMNLIENDELPMKAAKSINKREDGPKEFIVSLGLNRSKKELGLDNFCYFVYDSLDTDLSYSKMKNINNNNVVGYCFNSVSDDFSNDGTCILNLATLFVEDSFDNYVDEENYNNVIDMVVNNLIDSFERGTNIAISDFIEEIFVVTPVSIASYTSNGNMSSYGFKLNGLDNLLPRLLNIKNEEYIDGLYCCGGFDGDIFNEVSSYKIGFETAVKIIKKIEGR